MTGPAGSVPEVVGRGDVCPVLCWPGERGGLPHGLSEPRTRAELGFRKPCGREGTRGSPRGNPRDLGVRPPGFRGGGASGSGAEDSIGSQDVSPPVEASSSVALSSAALLPLHCLWDKSRKDVGLDRISVSILRAQLVSSGRAAAFGISKSRTWGSIFTRTLGYLICKLLNTSLGAGKAQSCFMGLPTGPYPTLTGHEPSLPSLQLILLEPVL